ncbi:MAG: PD-(D/E)XK nuclease domain-containing protein, partial [Bacteroidales bacterium]|nr:PD-(D/E)XK nuclease domain-containing protein [Bacteroidales bacterium]
ESGDVEMLMRRFTAFFADADYQVAGDAELYFQNTMYVILKLMGQQVQVERHTSNGRIDVLVQTDQYVYIIELKRDKDPQDALDQISDKGYDWPFLADGRKVFRIGATFSTANRRLEGWVWE